MLVLMPLDLVIANCCLQMRADPHLCDRGQAGTVPAHAVVVKTRREILQTIVPRTAASVPRLWNFPVPSSHASSVLSNQPPAPKIPNLGIQSAVIILLCRIAGLYHSKMSTEIRS